MESVAFQTRLAQLKMGWPGNNTGYNRKLWEWVYITQALQEAGVVKPGKKGLGFAVGQEPITTWLAARGCQILATDLAPEQAHQQGWQLTGQHTHPLADLNKVGVCDAEAFARNVSFRFVDMNHIPQDLTGFDFLWSSCSFEHLGDLQKGIDYVLNAMRCLRPGGVAVHTTEYNLSSNSHTITEGPTVLYRRRDIHNLASQLRQQDHRVKPLNSTPARTRWTATWIFPLLLR